jgi:NADPH-dependent ferric siderophore reductase
MPATRLTVTETLWLTPVLRRVRFRSDDLSAFAGSHFTDRYVKLVFPKPGLELPDDLDLRALRGVLPPDQLPTVRTYTALNPDVEAGTLDIDFVIHGDTGVAGPWAASAGPGDRLRVTGPGGAYRPDPEADWHLLAGDESALPAIGAALEALPSKAAARIVLLVAERGAEPRLTLPDGATVEYRYGSDSLADAVRAVEWLPGRVHAFVHGEAEEVMHGIRPYLVTDRGLPRSQVSISGYWRRGRAEEGFREWKAQLAAAEARGGEQLAAEAGGERAGAARRSA